MTSSPVSLKKSSSSESYRANNLLGGLAGLVTAGVVARAWFAECKAAFAVVKCMSRLAGRCKVAVSPLGALLDDAA